MSDQTELTTLVAAVRAGSSDALGSLYERTAGAVYGSAFRILGSQQEAEDVLQDVFVGLADALRNYDEQGKFESWLKRVTVRTALMRLRAQQRLREDSLDVAADVTARAVAAPVDRIAARDAIGRLPDTLRVVFMLKEVEGYSHAEIGEMLGITTGASAVRLTRAWEQILAKQERDR
jgi:RNA polymerase sigma factor (sigma-70 family)